jgi:hypothetical protein
MALLNLSLVTKTLINLLREYLIESPESKWKTGPGPPITQKPPDKVLDENTLCLYLYHISEDTQYKNLPAPGNDAPPIRYVPMGLNLYYQLSAHGSFTDEDDSVLPQLMMGIALKAFHDHPFIDDSTRINEGDFILDEKLQRAGNKLRIVLQPIAHNEAVNYWNNSSSGPRLSAYYQVSVVLLEPEETASRAGRVLEYGVHTFIQGAPRLDYSQNLLTFKTPDGTDREIKLRPAQVPVGEPVSFYGSGLNGDSVSLLLKNNRWKEPVEADTAWAIAVSEDKIKTTVQENADGNVILPGIYAALVKVIRRSTLRDGSTRDFEHLSNECPFAIAPRIDSISPSPVTVTDVVTVKGYIFLHTELKEGAVQVYLGENRLTLKTSGTLDNGEFIIDSASELRFRPPADLDPGLYPVRIFVNGTESPPEWIEVSS